MTADGPDADEPGDVPHSEEAFALLGDPVRAQIVRVLGAARAGEGARPVLPFSTLHSRVDSEARSSKFNYHLQRLVGPFVDKREDGYQLRPEGTAVYRAIEAGAFVRDRSFSGEKVGIDCYFCDAAVAASYEDGVLEIRCPDCEYRYLATTRIPAAAVIERENLLERADRYDRHKMLAFTRGVCPTCANGIETTIVAPERVPFPDTDSRDALVHRSCDHCDNQDYVPVGKAFLQHPTVISFFDERGVDVTATPQWEFEFAVTDRRLTVRKTDPWEVALTIPCRGDTLELVVDDDLSIVDRHLSTDAGIGA